MPWIIILIAAVMLKSTAYITWRDLGRDDAEVQFTQGIFTKVNKKTQPRLYWSALTFRLLIILALASGLMMGLAEKL